VNNFFCSLLTESGLLIPIIRSVTIAIFMSRTTIHDFQQWLEQTPPADYNTKALCRALRLSRRQLQRYTRQFFGLTPQQWLELQRILHALPSLKEEKLVKVVFASVGFRQASHFSRLFKKAFGVPPSAWLQLAPPERDAVDRLYLASGKHRLEGALCLPNGANGQGGYIMAKADT
jgi:AraC-like DNA-binding protein